MLLTTAYFPPVSWFAAVASEFTLSPDGVNPSMLTLEACENYQKQSYRNRCRIYSASGAEDLNVPVVHENGTFKLPITRIRIDYSVPWTLKTKRAISSAYDSSPYFEYYKDDIFAILDSQPETLWELNLRLIEFFLKKTGIAADISFTQEFSLESQERDLRWAIHPKKPDMVLEELGLKKPYFQVFARKYGFISNLSIMDLLFNEGPESIIYLKKF